MSTIPTPLFPNPDTIIVFHGPEQIREVAVRSCQDIEKQMDGCYDHTAPYVLFAHNKSHDAILKLVTRGIRLRYLTQVIKSNLSYCKKMVDDGIDVRHLDGVKGNFAIVDRTYCVLYTVQAEGQEPTQVLVTNSKSFVEQQQHFDILWDKAIPAGERIKQLEKEQEVKHEFIEAISDQLKIKTIYEDLILSSSKELLIILPSADFLIPLSQILQQTNNSKVRILVSIDKLEGIRQVLNEYAMHDIRYLVNSTSIQSNFVIMVSDEALSLSIELKEKMKSSFHEMTKSATYSNSESIVWTHASIFENLWIQSESHNTKEH